MLSTDEIINQYKLELDKYLFNGKTIDISFKYDILEANVIAKELRKNGYELINFFNGCDNSDIAIIKINDINKMKEIEKSISSEK